MAMLILTYILCDASRASRSQRGTEETVCSALFGVGLLLLCCLFVFVFFLLCLSSFAMIANAVSYRTEPPAPLRFLRLVIHPTAAERHHRPSFCTPDLAPETNSFLSALRHPISSGTLAPRHRQRREVLHVESRRRPLLLLARLAVSAARLRVRALLPPALARHPR